MFIKFIDDKMNNFLQPNSLFCVAIYVKLAVSKYVKWVVPGTWLEPQVAFLSIQDSCGTLLIFYKFIFIFSNLADAVLNLNGFKPLNTWFYTTYLSFQGPGTLYKCNSGNILAVYHSVTHTYLPHKSCVPVYSTWWQ